MLETCIIIFMAQFGLGAFALLLKKRLSDLKKYHHTVRLLVISIFMHARSYSIFRPSYTARATSSLLRAHAFISRSIWSRVGGFSGGQDGTGAKGGT